MAKTAQAKTAFDVTGLITEKNVKKEQKVITNNKHTQLSAGGFEIAKPKRETRSKRVNLVLQPSLYEKAQEFAKANGISFNEMITQMLCQITNTKPAEEDEHEQMTID